MVRIVVLISADIEWGVILELFPNIGIQHSPFGEWFTIQDNIVYFHGGWGKIAAAASTQFVIDHWHPELLINLGTCGGFAGEIDRGTIILVNRTIVYDIIEQMGDFDEHILHYTTGLNLDWLAGDYPLEVKKELMVSADRDLLIQEIQILKSKYNAIAGDWESGAIAWVAARNSVRCLILRGVTDLVGSEGGEAYGDMEFFRLATRRIMAHLVESLPGWLTCAGYI